VQKKKCENFKCEIEMKKFINFALPTKNYVGKECFDDAVRKRFE